MNNIEKYISDIRSIPWISFDEINNKIFFQQTSVNLKSNERISEIFELDLQSSKYKKITSGFDDSTPKISPNGKLLAFVRSKEISKNTKTKSIFIKDFRVNKEFQLTDDLKSIQSADDNSGTFNWDNTSTKIVYTYRLAELNDETIKPLVVNRLRYRHDVIGWVGDIFNQIELIDVSTNSIISVPNKESDDTHPVFSNDNKLVAFISDEGVERDTSWTQTVQIFNLESKMITKTNKKFGGLFSLTWSDNDTELIVVGTRNTKYGERRNSSLYSINLTNSEITNLNNNGVAFNPQPNLIYSSQFTISYTSRGTSFIADIDSKKGTVNILYGKNSKIVQISSAKTTQDIIFTENSRDNHERICAYNRENGKVEILYLPNKQFFQINAPSKMEKFEINRLNYQIESRLYFPNNINRSNTYPLVVDIHGGPHGRFEDQIAVNQEIFTSNNYIVLAVNPRGSSSYGSNFAEEVLEDWGGEDYLDLLKSIEELSKFPFIDLTNIGLYGHSYGGFMASWAIGHTNKFQAAVISAPCINLNSMSGTSDIGIKFGEEQWGGIRTDNIEKYRFNSPLTYVTNVDTPILLLCGEIDYRCPIEQAEQYYVSLKRLGKDIQFVRYPNQNHLMLNGGDPSLVIDYWRRTITFFDTHLKPKPTSLDSR